MIGPQQLVAILAAILLSNRDVHNTNAGDLSVALDKAEQLWRYAKHAKS